MFRKLQCAIRDCLQEFCEGRRVTVKLRTKQMREISAAVLAFNVKDQKIYLKQHLLLRLGFMASEL